jgi:hypothetical protein
MKTIKPVLLIVLAVLSGIFYGCENKPVTKKNLFGLCESKIVELYGKPDSIKLFSVSDSLLEYQYNLLNIYPAFKTNKINIKELLWQKGDQKTVFWLANKNADWVVIDNLIWNDDVKF